jgi:hypothetical protein
LYKQISIKLKTYFKIFLIPIKFIYGVIIKKTVDSLREKKSNVVVRWQGRCLGDDRVAEKLSLYTYLIVLMAEEQNFQLQLTEFSTK